MKNIITVLFFLAGLTSLLAQPMPDLTITKLTINGYGPESNQPGRVFVDYTAEIKNIGNAALNLNSSLIEVKGFLSKENKPHLGGQTGPGSTGDFNLKALANKNQLLPNEAVTVKFRCSGLAYEGSLYYILIVDNQKRVTESNENNNQLAQLLPRKQSCPSALYVTTKTTSVTADVTFNGIQGNSYTLKYRVKGSTTAWKEVLWNKPVLPCYFFINNLTPNTTYEYDLPCSYTDNGMADLGKIKQFTTQPCTDIKTVKAIVKNFSQTTAQVAGTTINGETYVLQYRIKGTPTWIMVTRTANSNFMIFDIANLRPDTTYEFALRTMCSIFYDSLQEFKTKAI